MQKPILLALASAIAVASCAPEQKSATINADLGIDNAGKIAYLVNYDTNEKIDSATINDSIAVFNVPDASSPILARILVEGRRYGQLVLEPGTVEFVTGTPSGTPLNDLFVAHEARQLKLSRDYRALPDSASEEQAQALIDEARAFTDSLRDANLDNPVGYYFFLQDAYEMSLPELDKAIAAHPALGNFERIQKLRQSMLSKAETSVGSKFKDFEVTYNDSTYRLSDYVGNGKYLLVDFWASWCGPCIRETKVIKELYNQYKDKGLEVLGVAVWDEPENTLQAIEQHELPWQQIINAQYIPTDIYGIPAIPCIILIDPEGNIISRDKQDEDLIADVRAAMESRK